MKISCTLEDVWMAPEHHLSLPGWPICQAVRTAHQLSAQYLVIPLPGSLACKPKDLSFSTAHPRLHFSQASSGSWFCWWGFWIEDILPFGDRLNFHQNWEQLFAISIHRGLGLSRYMYDHYPLLLLKFCLAKKYSLHCSWWSIVRRASARQTPLLLSAIWIYFAHVSSDAMALQPPRHIHNSNHSCRAIFPP